VFRQAQIFQEAEPRPSCTTWRRAGAGWCNTSRVAQADLGEVRHIQVDSALDTKAQARISRFGVVHTGLGYARYIQTPESAPSSNGGIGALRATWGISVVVGDSQELGIVAD